MPEKIEGLSIELDLETMKINSGLKDLKSQLTVVNSEMKANMSAFDRSDKSIAKYETRLQGLTKKYEVQKAVVDSSRKTYEKMVAEFGEGSKEAQKAAKEYNNQVASMNNLSRYISRVEKDLEQLREDQRIANSNWTKMGDHLDKAGNKMKVFGDKVTDVGNKMTTTVTPAVLGVGTAAGLIASNYEDSAVRIQNSLGLTAEEAKELTDISRNIYKNGFGESAAEIDHALLQVKQNIRDLNSEDLERITEKAFLLAETFESDLNEVTRAGNNVMKGFGIEADEAFDLMAKGAQNGLNFSNEMFDNLSEYSTLFASMGFSAEEYFELLQKGTDAGIYNLDYINDVMKEFQIRVKDGSDTTSDAMELLSKETQGVWKEFLKGDKTVKDVSNAVLKELEGMDDQVVANQVGVELFGTKFEDLESEAMYSLGGIGDGLEDVEGTMDEMTKNAERSISREWKATWREAKEVLLPVGETLLEFTREVLPDVKDGIEDVTEWFSELDEEGKRNILMFGGIAAAAGPVLSVVGGISSGIGGLMKVTGGLSKLLGVSGGAGLLGRIGLLGVTGGPVGLAIGGVGLLSAVIYTLSQNSKQSTEETLQSIEARKQEIDTLDGLITQYEELQSKNKLSTDEVLRYMDIASELKEAKTEEAIVALKKEQEKLLEKSTLTNKEMEEFLRLNGEIVDKTPTSVQAISEQGNAYAGVIDKVKELNEVEKNRLIDDTYESIKEGLDEHKQSLEEQREIQREIKDLESERSSSLMSVLDYNTQIQEKDLEIAAIKDQINRANNDEAIKLSEKLVSLEDERLLLDSIRDKHNREIEKLDTKISKKNESLDTTKQEIESFEMLLGEYEALILNQVGLNAERGNGLEALDQEIAKQLEIRNGLNEQKDVGELTTAEYNKRVQEAQDEIDKLREAKKELQNINTIADTNVFKERNSDIQAQNKSLDKVKSNATDINSLLGKDISKSVTINPSPSISSLNEDLRSPVTRRVTVEQVFQNANNPFGNPANNADGTSYFNHPSGLSWLGEEGPELVRHGNKWAMADFGLYSVPRGAQVFTNDETNSIMTSLLDIPKLATGVSPSGEADRIVNMLRNNSFNKLLAILGKESAETTRTTESNYVTSYIKDLLSATLEQNQILSQLLAKDHNTYIDSYELARTLEAPITEMQEMNKKVRDSFA
ncbi:phage tail tape measure protein [Gracilibacillus marinus]|uniref:Phage tail tape measure protein n=1 Tax=Gracilibacillus marinus TaxID=630535 RepID=A0ABV8VSS1_9BACI